MTQRKHGESFVSVSKGKNIGDVRETMDNDNSIVSNVTVLNVVGKMILGKSVFLQDPHSSA